VILLCFIYSYLFFLSARRLSSTWKLTSHKVVASMPDKVKRSNASRDFKLLVNIALIIKMLDVLEEKMSYLDI